MMLTFQVRPPTTKDQEKTYNYQRALHDLDWGMDGAPQSSVDQHLRQDIDDLRRLAQKPILLWVKGLQTAKLLEHKLGQNVNNIDEYCKHSLRAFPNFLHKIQFLAEVASK